MLEFSIFMQDVSVLREETNEFFPILGRSIQQCRSGHKRLAIFCPIVAIAIGQQIQLLE
jgi:hypothetical protein